MPIHRDLVAAVSLLAAAGCAASQNAEAKASATIRRLPVVFASSTGKMPGLWGKGRKIRYETARDIRDPRQLRPEAESLWTELRASAEADSVCTVELEASEPEKRARVPGAGDFAFVARRNFSFVLRHDSAGSWRWLTTDDPPATGCN